MKKNVNTEKEPTKEELTERVGQLEAQKESLQVQIKQLEDHARKLEHTIIVCQMKSAGVI